MSKLLRGILLRLAPADIWHMEELYIASSRIVREYKVTWHLWSIKSRRTNSERFPKLDCSLYILPLVGTFKNSVGIISTLVFDIILLTLYISALSCFVYAFPQRSDAPNIYWFAAFLFRVFFFFLTFLFHFLFLRGFFEILFVCVEFVRHTCSEDLWKIY